MKNKRGRPRKSSLLKSDLETKTKSKRERIPPKSKDLPIEQTPKPKRKYTKSTDKAKTEKSPTKGTKKVVDEPKENDFDFDENDDVFDKEIESNDDEDFNIEEQNESSSSSPNSIEEIEDDEIKEISNFEVSDDEKERSAKKTRRSSRHSIQPVTSTSEEANETDENLVLKIDIDQVIPEWKYELDLDSKLFFRPKLPLLSESAIEPFLNKNSKPPKCYIYDCPHCNKMFTYSLVFKNHLFSCSKNKNVPS